MLRPEDRAASEVIGAVLIFGFLVIAFSIYQGVVVPNQNRGIEFDHNQAVHDSMQDLRNAIRQTATTGAEESVSINLGPSYPQRILAVNPGASAGSLQTESLGLIILRNVSATDAETADYFGTSTTTLGSFESKTLVYRPIYFQYRQAPNTLYENTLAYNQFPNGVNLSITDQAVIDDRKITLIALNGSVSKAQQGTVSVDTKGLSTATNAVSVTNESGPINITFASRLTAANWTDLLQGEFTPDGHVTAVKQSGPNQVSIILEGGITYELRLAKVGVGSGTASTDPKYIVDVEGDGTSVVENGTRKLVVGVRDRFNNPMSNVTVDATITQPSNSSDPREDVSPASATTGADGRATFTYTAPEQVEGAQEADIEVSFEGDGTDNETVTFDMRVLDADGSGGGGGDDGGGTDDINPSESGDVVLINATRNGDFAATLTFDNTADSVRTTDAVRISFYYSDQAQKQPNEATINGTTFPIGGTLDDGEAVVVTLSQGINTVDITFGGDDVQTRGDFFILSIQFEEVEGTKTYFVAVEQD